jgi:two-component system response regulator PilR (NtrC family)
VLDVDGLPSSVLERSAKARTPAPVATAEGANLDEILASYERGLLSDALQRAGGVKKRAARLLGISFRSFRYRLEKLGLDDPGTGEDEE